MSAIGEIGSQIGPYKLLNVLGEGGFRIVYLAEQARLTSEDIDVRSNIYSLPDNSAL